MPTSGVLQNWMDDFEYMTRETNWGVLIGRGHRMMMLERLIHALMGARRGVRDDAGGRAGASGQAGEAVMS